MPRIIDKAKQNIVGENVKKLRTQQNMTQKQLAEKLELLAIYVCRGSISRIENGERTVTDIEVDGFCKALGATLQELFNRE